MRALAAIVLLLASFVFAETQDSVYFRALKAEEAGDVSESLNLFETALTLPGPYTEEIRGILNDYYEVLGMDDVKQGNVSFRFSSDVGTSILHYNEYGGVHSLKEYGAVFFALIETYVDFYSDGWLKTFNFSFLTDFFLNSKMPSLDTNDWVLTPSLGFSLIGEDLMWNTGLDFKEPEGSAMEISWYNWIEKRFFQYERHSIGVSFWDYLNSDGPLVLAAFANWHKYSLMGLNFSLSMGVRFDADSVVDVNGIPKEFDVVDKKDEELPLENNFLDEKSIEKKEFYVPMYWGKWIGPNLRLRTTYKFRRNFSLNVKLNLFYGYVIDWPCNDGKDMRKFSGSWGGSVNWNPSFYTIYLGLEQIYMHYTEMPDSYIGLYPKNSFLTEVIFGVKTDF